MTYPPLPVGRRIGFWVADDDVYGADPVFGNAAGAVPTPQQFFNAYFLTSPFPATMVWTGGLYSSAAHSVPPAQEAQWFSQLLGICDGYPDIQIWAIFFINLSGNSIVAGVSAPPPSSGLSNTGFTAGRQSPLTFFTVTAAAGLKPSTMYILELLDNNLNLIANITQFTTDSMGAWSGAAALPNTTDAQASAGGYIRIAGTNTAVFTGWQNDQTAAFQNYMNTIGGHPSFIGALFEPEYYGDTPQVRAAFKSIVNGASYYNLGSTNDPVNGELVMRYSTYPYFQASGGVLYTGTAPPGELGVHYGETGGPIPPDPQPIWTQAVVQNIVSNSEAAPITIVISVDDVNNPAGNSYLYMSPVLRGWIASDPAYANFLPSNGSVGPTPTTLTLTAKPT